MRSERPIARRTTQELIGPVVGTYVGRALAPRDFEGAASGGVASALTRFLLESGAVQGVMTASVSIKEGHLAPEAVFATDTEQLLPCRNSLNFSFQLGTIGPFTFRDLVAFLESNPAARVAVVGLHCHLRSLTSMLERHGIERDRVLMIGLFCSHAPDPRLLDDVFRRVGADMTKAVGFQLKTGGVGADGRLHATSTVTYADGSTKVFKLTEYTILKNLWFDADRRCLLCTDMFAEEADISLGDAWYPEIRQEPHKHNTVVSRTAWGDEVLRSAARAGAIELRALSAESVVSSQRRVTGVFKVAGASRTRMGRAFGVKLPPIEGDITALDRVHSAMLLANYRASQSPGLRGLLMRLPTWAFLPAISAMKLVESRLLGKIPKGSGVGDRIDD